MSLPSAKFITETGLYSARILADSFSPANVRLTTIEATFPRFILAEVNTHRVFSRNSASSRAIPTQKLIERIEASPFVPETFNKRVKGMGVGAPLDESQQAEARERWLRACRDAIDHAQWFADADTDKSRANRLLEPFMWHTAIITSTEWDNFFALRCPNGEQIDFDFPAQPEFQQIAILIRRAMQNSEPQSLKHGQWHTPLVDNWDEAMEQDLQEFGTGRTRDAEQRVLHMCARRLARVSFDRHTENEQYSVSIGKAGELVKSGHFSPTEHIARPLSSRDTTNSAITSKLMMPVNRAREYRFIPSEMWSGNLRGWFQWRKQFAFEHNHRLAVEAADE